MIHISGHGPVTCFKMGREINGQVMYWCAAYQVGDVLVDSGCAHTRALSWPRPSRAGGWRAVLNTHHHEDHIGGNALLAERLGVELYAPRRLPGAPGRAREGTVPLPDAHVGTARPASRPRPLGSEVRAGEYRLEVIPAPGHSDDLVVYYEPDQGWAFVSDLWVAPPAKDQPGS